MNCNQIHGVLSLLFIVLFGGVAHGAVVLQPPGLAAGDQYRLIFLTSTTRTAISSNIDDYNDFVQLAADASPLAALGTTWRAIGSTSAVDADVNTGTQQVGVNDYPIYRVDGLLAARGNGHLWNTGESQNNLIAGIFITEHGMEATHPVSWVWTGTSRTGTATGVPLGSQFVSTGDPLLGTDRYWIESDTIVGSNNPLPLYALSAPITVVPEPTSCALAGMAIAVGASRRRRSKKSQGSPPALPNA